MVTRKTEHRTLYLLDSSYDEDERRFDQIVCELDGYPGWRILPEVAVTDRGLLLRRLVIEPSDGMPEPGITTRMLRQLRTGDLIAALRAAARQHEQIFGDAPDLSVTTRVGRRGRDDLYYARWAAAYVEALANRRGPSRISRRGTTSAPRRSATSCTPAAAAACSPRARPAAPAGS